MFPYNMAFVHANGDDNTAEVGNINKPFSTLQKAINVVLAFEGLMLSLEGRLSPRPKVATLTEAQRREKRLHEKLVQRGAHDNIFKYCRAELLEENYFHSIF